jgi:hypothetical protein
MNQYKLPRKAAFFFPSHSNHPILSDEINISQNYFLL